MIYTLLLVEQAGNSSLLVSSNASRYLDTPVDAVFLTVLSVGLHCQLTSARLDASIMVNDAGEEHYCMPSLGVTLYATTNVEIALVCVV